MAIESVEEGGQWWWRVTPSEAPTWRMTWDKNLIVQDLIETDDETLNLAIIPLDAENPNIFEGPTKQKCIDRAAELGLYYDPVVES